MLFYRISHSVGRTTFMRSKASNTVSLNIKNKKTCVIMLSSDVYATPIVRYASTLEYDRSPNKLLGEIKSYEETIKTLNTLQSNADSIRNSIFTNKKQAPLFDTIQYLNRSGLNLEDIEKLSVIHVSGTKGKGSTCASTESILRAHGVKTGFYSSPHLISVNERIRINGSPISKEKFIKSFWKVYRALYERRHSALDMPAYFKFLTILCFHIFLEENVDVAIIEVGIGGTYDCTNIIRNTEIVGITSLGLEHTQLLGDTLIDIAKQKAGIIKSNSQVFTTVTQSECLNIIRDTANENNATLVQVPEISFYFQDTNTSDTVDALNNVTQMNGSLAIQLANAWLQLHYKSKKNFIFDGEKLNEKFRKGLMDSKWLGRCQIERINNLNIHLDGAHTIESITMCSNWFRKVIKNSSNKRILIFNTTGDRDSKLLLEILYKMNKFDFAIFVPNIPCGITNKDDNVFIYMGSSDQINRANDHAKYWRILNNDNKLHELVFNNILESFKYLNETYKNDELNILVTGSLHLIGATIYALEEFKRIDCVS